MAFKVGDITANLSLNISQFTKAMGQALDGARNLGSQLSSAFGPGTLNNMNRVNGAAKDMASHLKDVDRIVSGIIISQVFYQAANAIQEGVSALFRFSNNMQTAQVSMEYFLGSAERAEGFIKVMQDFAASTPFSTEQSLDLSRKLMAMGFQAENIRSIMQILVDAAAASGGTADELNRIVIALGQINTQGYLAGQELRQLANANIPIYKILQEELGLTADQMKNIGQLKIPADQGVAAVLQGLRKRYQGASDELNERTITGMWANIKDDILIVGEQVIKVPHQMLHNFVKDIYDVMETARDVITKSGLGGLFEHFVPPGMQQTIRTIIASIKSLGQSLGILANAFKPVIAAVGTTFVNALAIVLPVLATVARVVAEMAAAMLNASPLVRFFAASIVTLLVANTVAKSLMFLWTVTRMGVVCAAVARAVTLLSKAIQGLFIVMTRNPLVGIALLIAGALLSIALSSKTVIAWLDSLMAKLGGLAGIDTSGILQPEVNDGIDKWIDEFNKDLDHMNDSLKDVGKNLEEDGKKGDKAGKKIKDKFVASFDELYRIPEDLGKIGDGLDGIGDIDMALPDMPDLKLPNLDMPGIPGGGLDNPFDGITPIFGPGFWGTIPPLNLAPVTDALATVNSLILQLKEALQNAWGSVYEWGANVVTSINGFITNIAGAFALLPNLILTPIADLLTDMLNRFSVFVTEGVSILGLFTAGAVSVFTQWVADTSQIIGDWVVNTAERFAQWSLETVGDFARFASEASVVFAQWSAEAGALLAGWILTTSERFKGWVTQTVADLSNWVTQTTGQLANWVTQTTSVINNWASQTVGSFNNWVTQTTGAISGWSLQTVAQIVSWGLNTQATFNTWITSTKASIATWVTDVKAQFTTWASNVLTTITQWSANTISNIGTWITTTKTNFVEWSKGVVGSFKEWASEVSKNIIKWAQNTVGNFGVWADNTSKNFASWAKGTFETFKEWLTGTSVGVAAWAKNVITNFGVFATSGAQAVGAFAKAAGKTLSGWLKGAASGVYEWAKGTIETITSWARSAWSVISDLASTVGANIGDYFTNLGHGIKEAWAPTLDWAREHKTELIVGGLAAAVVIGSFALAPATGGWSLAGLAALETGGIVDRDGIYRMGEGNKREVVIPLENSSYMKPFSAAVANDLAGMLGSQPTQQGSDDRPIVYVHTLIADERGLKDLERKLEIIRTNEATRKGE